MEATISTAERKARSVARRWPEFERQVIRGQAHAQVIWQPRILAWWSDKIYFGEPFPGPFDRMSQPG